MATAIAVGLGAGTIFAAGCALASCRVSAAQKRWICAVVLVSLAFSVSVLEPSTPLSSVLEPSTPLSSVLEPSTPLSRKVHNDRVAQLQEPSAAPPCTTNALKPEKIETRIPMPNSHHGCMVSDGVFVPCDRTASV